MKINTSLVLLMHNPIRFSLLVLLSFSCAVNSPQSVLFAYDTQTKKRWQWPIIEENTDNYSLTVFPEENIGEMLPFFFTLKNHGNDSLLIDPSTWHILFKPSANHQLSDSISINPLTSEQVSIGFNKMAEKLKRKENARTAVLVILGTLFIVGIIIFIAASSDELSEEEEEDSDFGLNIAGNIDEVENTDQVLSVEDKIKHLQLEATRYAKSTLAPVYIKSGETLEFRVFYPKEKNLRSFTLHANVNSEQFRWTFVHYELYNNY